MSKPKPKTTYIGFHLPTRDYDRLQLARQLENRGVSSIGRDAIRAYLANSLKATLAAEIAAAEFDIATEAENASQASPEASEGASQ